MSDPSPSLVEPPVYLVLNDPLSWFHGRSGDIQRLSRQFVDQHATGVDSVIDFHFLNPPQMIFPIRIEVSKLQASLKVKPLISLGTCTDPIVGKEPRVIRLGDREQLRGFLLAELQQNLLAVFTQHQSGLQVDYLVIIDLLAYLLDDEQLEIILRVEWHTNDTRVFVSLGVGFSGFEGEIFCFVDEGIDTAFFEDWEGFHVVSFYMFWNYIRIGEMRVLFSLWITLAICLEINMEIGSLGVVEPIDAVALSNRSLVVANRTQLYLFEAVGKQSFRLAFNHSFNEQILNLQVLKDYLCISTNYHLYLLFQSNFTVFQSTNLPSFQEYQSVAFSEADGKIFYLPLPRTETELIEYRWPNTHNTKIIRKEIIQQIEYFCRQFLLVGSQSGIVSLYNTSSKGQLGEDTKLCEVISGIKVVDSEKGVVICKEGRIWMIYWEGNTWKYSQLEFKGYSAIAFSGEDIFLANTTHFLFHSPKISAQTERIGNLTKIIYTAFLNNTHILLLDQHYFVIINLSDNNTTDTSDILPIIGYALGGTLVFLCLICLWRRSRKRAKASYNADESQLTVLLIEDK